MRDKAKSTPGFLSLELAADWSSVSKKTIKRWLAQGLHFSQVGPRTKVLIDPHDIRAFLAKRQKPKPRLDQMVEECLQDLNPNRQKELQG